MQTVGSYLKSNRLRKKVSRSKLAKKTRIKEIFIAALEEEQWNQLPTFTTTSGFVRTLVQTLGANPDTAVALLRREYPPEQSSGTKQSFILWTPKHTTILGIAIILLMIGIYFFRQYTLFVAPPLLEVTIQKENDTVLVTGKTHKYATVTINNNPVIVQSEGTFNISFAAQSGQTIKIEALSRNGKATRKEMIIP